MGDEQADLTGTTLGKKFFVRRRIGSGGMGAVYEVEHVLTKRVGALKLLHESVASSPRIVERFVREASAAGRIGNPHIVETIDAGELPSGEPYMFMELLDGSNVSDLIKRRGRLSFEEAREIVLQAAEGLGAAHAAGIVHRDVKPENLFLCRGEPPYVKLLDFGISKFELGGGYRLTAEGAPMGTPYYMSPEQVAGKSDVGPSSDVYSLGVVLYECVTGSVPYDAGTLPALSIKIFEGKYAPPSSLLAAAPPGLDELIARAMATAPSERYASMEELRAALLGFGRSTPLSLASTLETTSAGLGITADAAPHSGPAARGTMEAPRSVPRALEPDTHSPATLASPRSRGYRGAAFVVALALMTAAAVWGLQGRGAEPTPSEPPDGSAPARLAADAPLETPASASAVATSEVAPHHSARALPRVYVPAPRARPSHGPALSTPSKAARDGLSEQNPFAE